MATSSSLSRRRKLQAYFTGLLALFFTSVFATLASAAARGDLGEDRLYVIAGLPLIGLLAFSSAGSCFFALDARTTAAREAWLRLMDRLVAAGIVYCLVFLSGFFVLRAVDLVRRAEATHLEERLEAERMKVSALEERVEALVSENKALRQTIKKAAATGVLPKDFARPPQ